MACQVHPYVDEYYFSDLKELSKLVAVGTANLILMGIEPTYSSENYGYITPFIKNSVSKVSIFKEKSTEVVTKGNV